jgi:hypothetical protein
LNDPPVRLRDGARRDGLRDAAVRVEHGVFAGPPAPNYHGHYKYENMNFGLCRILIAIINGNINQHAILPDFVWDPITITDADLSRQPEVDGRPGRVARYAEAHAARFRPPRRMRCCSR